ncbi:MAG: hypothetical protein Q8M31_21960 [Beijerinckiaceae bacterium]|nr:hypothetical protein [Beijerinckiaceae bacterium]
MADNISVNLCKRRWFALSVNTRGFGDFAIAIGELVDDAGVDVLII